VLNEKQKSFCNEYVIDYNATRAAIKAGYSEKSARSMASTLLTKQNIKEYIAELTKEKSKENKSWIEQLIKMREHAIPVYRGLLNSDNELIRFRVCESLFQLDKIDLSDDKPEQDNF
jgi:phosphoserine phosphatase